MKKRTIASIMTACLMLSLVGCGAKEEAAVAATEVETEAATEEVTTEAEQDGKAARGEEATETVEEAPASDTPVLGGENVEGYDGFEYLYEEILMTETEENKETGKKERAQLTVYIPDDEYARADGDYAYANAMGVDFRVELDPSMLRYDAEDYLLTENLDYYMEYKYDPFNNASYGYRDVVVTEAEELGKDAVRTTVEYCKYNEWDDVYSAVFGTYYLKELDNGKMVMVSVEIDSAEATGKAEFLIEELEQFYQFDINWDADRAEQKALDYAENGTENTYTSGNLMFELPEGWAEDNDISSYDMRVYAPEGDYAFSGCMVSVGEEYLGYDESVDLNVFVNEKESVEAILGSTVSDYSAEVLKTNIGNAAKINCSVNADGVSASIVIYVVESEYNVYTIMAFQTDSAIEDAAAVVEGIVTTGQIRSY